MGRFDNPPEFRAKPYPGRVTDYIPDERNAEIIPTPNLVLRSSSVLRAVRHPGAIGYRSLDQGTKNHQRLHNYSYGKSKPHLRPSVTEDEDLAWLATLHEPTRRWLLRRKAA